MSGFSITTPVKGFTLIEVLVVLTISGLLLVLVGALSVDQIKRADRLAELNSVEQFIRISSKYAELNKSTVLLVAEDSKLTLHSPDGDPIDTLEFKYLSFTEQSIRFNRNGFGDRQSLSATSDRREVSLAIPTAFAYEMSRR